MNIWKINVFWGGKYLVELTVPFEHNILKANERKAHKCGVIKQNQSEVGQIQISFF